MKITQKIPYMLKRAVPSIMLVGATLLPGCNKEEQKHDVVLDWDRDSKKEIEPANVRKYVDDPTVNMIYLRLARGGNFSSFGDRGLHTIREKYIAPLVAMDPARVRGRGNFVMEPGDCFEEDSLWFVAHGWTVNIQNQIPLQNQR